MLHAAKRFVSLHACLPMPPCSLASRGAEQRASFHARQRRINVVPSLSAARPNHLLGLVGRWIV